MINIFAMNSLDLHVCWTSGQAQNELGLGFISLFQTGALVCRLLYQVAGETFITERFLKTLKRN